MGSTERQLSSATELVLDADSTRWWDAKTASRFVKRSLLAEYAEMMKAGADFPVRVWFDGKDYWLVVGFHRIAAARRSGLAAFSAEILRGTLEEAQWDSYACNAIHGLRRTPADVESVVKRALNHPSRRTLSNNQIARHLHLPEATLRRWKKRLSSSSDEDATSCCQEWQDLPFTLNISVEVQSTGFPAGREAQ